MLLFLVVLKADVSLAKNSAAFAKEFVSSHKKLDYLIITVGILPDYSLVETSEGVERDFAISFFASRFVLLHHMLDFLKASKTRVFLLGMFGGDGTVDLDDIQSKKSYGAMKVQGITHLANAMLIQQLSKKVDGAEFFGLSPGVVNSEAYKTWTGDTWKGWLLDLVISIFGKSTDSYAEAMIHAVVSDELHGRSGSYFDADGNSQGLSKFLEEGNNSDRFYKQCLDLMNDILSEEKKEKK